MQSETKTCLNCRASFTIEPDDFGFYEKIYEMRPVLPVVVAIELAEEQVKR